MAVIILVAVWIAAALWSSLRDKRNQEKRNQEKREREKREREKRKRGGSEQHRLEVTGSHTRGILLRLPRDPALLAE